MLCLRITPGTLSKIHRTVTTELRTYKFIAPNIRNNVTKKIHPHALSPLTLRSIPVLFPRRACSSKSTETETQSEQQETDTQNSQPETEPQNSQPETEPVRLIYRYPNIAVARTITKVKIFQTILVCGLVPYIYSGYLDGQVSYLTMMSSIGIGVISTLMLYVVSDLISKIICILKYNQDTGDVYISHINFWGRRRDTTVQLSNIVPISDSTENITDTYIKVNTYDKSESFLIFINGCPEDEKKEILRILG